MSNKVDYLVIGSNSFSGSSLIDYILKKKIKVLGVSRSKQKDSHFLGYKNNPFFKKNFIFRKIDLNHDISELVRLINYYKISNIINFSSQSMVSESWDKPLDWYYTNVIATIKFYEKIKDLKFIKKIIHFTTPEVYGSTNKFIKENFNFNPSTPYALSRATSDLHLKFLYDYYKMPVIFTRAANVYGEYQQLYRIIPKTIWSINEKEKLFLHGGGNSKRSFIHTEDVNNALWKIIKRGKIGDCYHISSSNFISIKNLVNKICNIMSYNFQELVEVGHERVGKDLYYKLSSNKLKNELQWNSKISIDEGLIKTIKWFNEYYSNFKTQDLKYKHKK